MPQCQFLFSAVFVFQKSYTGNILGIGQFEDRSSYFYRAEAADLEGVEEKSVPLTAFRTRYGSYPLNNKVIFHEEFRSAAAIDDKFRGTESLFRHAAGTGNCPRSHLHRHHRHLHRRCWLPWWGGSSSPPRLRALPVAMWFISLSHGVIFMWSCVLLVSLNTLIMFMLLKWFCLVSGVIVTTRYQGDSVGTCVTLWII